jgi:hypothetical protein
MALYQLALFPISTVTKLTFSSRTSLGLSRNGCFPSQVRCMVATETCDQSIARRSGNYPTPFWDHKFLQSLTSEYVVNIYTYVLHYLYYFDFLFMSTVVIMNLIVFQAFRNFHCHYYF